jgi:riboflavin kinase / FMN adenylyltransferase
MKVRGSLEARDSGEPFWVSMGIFDGVHAGHRAILRRLVSEARRDGVKSLVVTFDPHPRAVLDPAKAVGLLTPGKEKLERLEAEGVDETAVLPFTGELAGRPPEIFMREVLIRGVRVRGLIAGYNHAFGSRRRGDGELLGRLGAELGFPVRIEPPVMVDGEPVSSTRIRGLVEAGLVGEAAELLERPYEVRGRVVRGKGLGRGFGFPTANVRPERPDKLVPGDGVYAAFVRTSDGRKPAVVNVGTCPTVGEYDRSIEAHLMDFEGNLYDQPVGIDWIHKLRDEIRFDSVQTMIGQMGKDLGAARNRLNGQGG